MKNFCFAVIACFLYFWSVPAQATLIEVKFTVSGFVDYKNVIYPSHTPVVPPTDPVSGKIIYESVSPTGVINSISSVDLNIGGYQYSIDDIGYISPAGDYQYIGGKINDVNGLWDYTDDFVIIWELLTLEPYSFLYTINDSGGYFSSILFDSFSVQVVPEPTTMLLLGAGLLGLAGLGRKKFFKKD